MTKAFWESKREEDRIIILKSSQNAIDMWIASSIIYISNSFREPLFFLFKHNLKI